MTNIIELFSRLGFTQNEALEQLIELNELIGKAVFAKLTEGVSKDKLSANEVLNTFGHILQEEANQRIAIDVATKISSDYIDAISSNLNQIQKQELLKSIVEYSQQTAT